MNRLPSLAAIKKIVDANPPANRYRDDPLYCLRVKARARVSQAIKSKGFYKHGKTAEILGCTFEELKRHIEKQFKKGMRWENYSEWHIDHIVPVSAASTPEELEPLLHYMNLQPLWAKENVKKGATMLDSFQLHLCLPC
jgi:hypothetical protein